MIIFLLVIYVVVLLGAFKLKILKPSLGWKLSLAFRQWATAGAHRPGARYASNRCFRASSVR